MTCRSRPWTMRTTSPLSTDKEPGLRQTNRVVNQVEDTLLEEEVTNPDQDQKEEEAQTAEITQTEMANSATFASSKDTDRKNAERNSRKTNLVEMAKDEPTGRGSTSWTRIRRQRQPTPFTMRMSDTRMRKAHLTLLEFNISQELQPICTLNCATR